MLLYFTEKRPCLPNKDAAVPVIMAVLQIFVGGLDFRLLHKRLNLMHIAMSHERRAINYFPCLDISIPCFRAVRFYTYGHQKIVFSGLDRLSKDLEELVRFPDGMIGG